LASLAGKPKQDMDIWVMDRTEGGDWGEPRNLGAPVNTTASEWFPTVAAGGTLSFGSGRPGGHGRTDRYRARRAGGTLAGPENLGPGVNGAAGVAEEVGVAGGDEGAGHLEEVLLGGRRQGAGELLGLDFLVGRERLLHGGLTDRAGGFLAEMALSRTSVSVKVLPATSVIVSDSGVWLAALMSAIRSETVAAVKLAGIVRSSSSSRLSRRQRRRGAGGRVRRPVGDRPSQRLHKSFNHIVDLLSEPACDTMKRPSLRARRPGARAVPGR
jgi:hypothetical protein